MERHNNFDLLRLVAALSVILSHSFLLAENSQEHDPLIIATAFRRPRACRRFCVLHDQRLFGQSELRDSTPPIVFLAKRALRIFPV